MDLFNKLLPLQAQVPQVNISNNIADQANRVVNQMMSSGNPQQMFNSVLQSNPDAKKTIDLINQYGNGNPKAAFQGYMNTPGKQAFGQQILKKYGLSL